MCQVWWRRKRKSVMGPDDWGTSISVLGCPLQPLLLCGRKTCALLNHLFGLLLYALTFLLTGTFLLFWRCLLSSNVFWIDQLVKRKQRYDTCPSVGHGRREVPSCSAFFTRLSGCYEGSQGYAYRGEEVQGRLAVDPALCTLAVHLNSH